MTLDKASELNCNTIKMVLAEVDRDFAQAAIDKLILYHQFAEKWQLKPGDNFTSAFTN